MQQVTHSRIHQTRNANNLPLINAKKTVKQRSSAYLSIKVFNSIPIGIRNLSNKKQFKKECKNKVLNEDRQKYHEIIDIKNKKT